MTGKRSWASGWFVFMVARELSVTRKKHTGERVETWRCVLFIIMTLEVSTHLAPSLWACVEMDHPGREGVIE